MILQRGGFVLGLVAGLLVGLALALGVALYITKAPIPFINKVPNRTAQQDTAEAERNRNWDPNAPLGTRTPARPASAAPVAPVAATPVASAPAVTTVGPKNKDPAAILAGGTLPIPAPAINNAPKSTAPGADAFVYFLQIGAYTNSEEAEQQRAKLALSGLVARVTEREQAGRTVYRVRLGPFEKRDEADALQSRLTETNVESRLVRVERS